MNAIRHIGSRFHLLFCISFIIFVPFPYYILPDSGSYASAFLTPLIRYAGEALMGLEHTAMYEAASDSTGMYVLVALLMVLSLLIALVWSIKRPGPLPAKTGYWFTAIISYYLSLQLLIYGFDKLFKHQFYLPEPNTLYTPLGALSRDILYWSTVGSSYQYTVISGFIEILAALFLLFRRSQQLAAILATGIMCHVALINFGFDISVKVYTCFLLYLCLLLAFPAIRALFRFFVLKQALEPEPDTTGTDSPSKKAIRLVLKGLVISCLFWEALYVHVISGNYNDDLATRPYLHGAYEVKHYVKNGDTLPPLLTDDSYIRRFFIHREGYFIIQGMNDEFRDFRLQYDTTHHLLMLFSDHVPAMQLHYTFAEKDSTLTLTTRLNNDSMILSAKRLDLTSLPLLKSDFHWTSDDF